MWSSNAESILTFIGVWIYCHHKLSVTSKLEHGVQNTIQFLWMTVSCQQGLFLSRNLPWIASWYLDALACLPPQKSIVMLPFEWEMIHSFDSWTEPTQPVTIFVKWNDHYWSPVVVSCSFQMYACKFGKCQLSFLDGNYTDDKRTNFLSNGHWSVFQNHYWNHDHYFFFTNWI